MLVSSAAKDLVYPPVLTHALAVHPNDIVGLLLICLGQCCVATLRAFCRLDFDALDIWIYSCVLRGGSSQL
jgi:hypothetical protein